MKVEQKDSFMPIELWPTDVRKNEKETFLKELEKQYDKVFAEMKGKVLYYRVTDKKDNSAQFLLMDIAELKPYYMKDIETLFDEIPFKKVDCKASTKDDEFEIVFWKPLTCASMNGYSVYIRYIKESDYNAVVNEIDALPSVTLQTIYRKFLSESYWKVTLEDLEKKLLSHLNYLIRDAFYTVESLLTESNTLEEENTIQLVQQELSEFTDEIYLLCKDNITAEYSNPDSIVFRFEDKICFSFRRTMKIEYSYEYN